jgi:hypothetical protein
MIHLGAQILTEWLALWQRFLCSVQHHKMHQVGWSETDETLQCPHCMATASINHETRTVKVWKG